MDERRALEDAAVFADTLTSAGDPRGELLTLELAARRTPRMSEARRLNGEAQALRERHEARVWPPALVDNRDLRLHAGFAIVLSDAWEPLSPARCPASAFARIRRLDLHRAASLGGMHERLNPEALRAPFADSSQLDAITRRPGLRSLELTGRAELIEDEGRRFHRLPRLERLVVQLSGRTSLAAIAELPLRAFGGRSEGGEIARAAAGIASGPGTLRELRLRQLDPVVPAIRREVGQDASLAHLAGLGGLERLELVFPDTAKPDAPEWTPWWEWAAAQPLSALAVTMRQRPVLGPWLVKLGKLRSLRVQLHDAFLDVASLPTMPFLEHLDVDGDCRRCELLPRLASLELIPAALHGLRDLPASHLGIHDQILRFAGDPARLLRRTLTRLQGMVPLRRLDMPASLLRGPPRRFAAALPDLEELELHGRADPWPVEILAALPGLRQLVIRELHPVEQRELSRALPQVCVRSTRLWPRAVEQGRGAR